MSNFVIISVTVLGIFILFILNKRKKIAPDYTLIVLNLICSVLLLASLKIENELSPLSFYIHNTLPFWLFGVFMLYAAQLLTSKNWQHYYWVFFILSIPMTIFVTYDVYIAHEDFNIILESRFLNPPFIYHFFYKGNMIYAIILSFGLLRKLKTYTGAIQNNFSYIEKIRLRWLNHYAIALICIYSFSLIAFLLYNIGLIKNIDDIYVVLNSLVILAFFYLSFHGVRHYSLETIPSIDESPINISKETVDIVASGNSNNANEKTEGIYQNLLQLFEETQLFTQAQLKLSDVAAKINVPSHQLSQVINSHYGKPFYDFVATYRVNLLKERLRSTESQQYTILSLGLDCGFNSKASLNRVFKEHTGLTPSQFQKSHLAK